MYMNLSCPKCGFAFAVGFPKDVDEETVKEIMTCPCGCLMVEETDRIKTAFFMPQEMFKEC